MKSTNPLPVIQPLPPFGHPDACDCYDEDCLLMTRDEHIARFEGSLAHGVEVGKPEGICPFMD